MITLFLESLDSGKLVKLLNNHGLWTVNGKTVIVKRLTCGLVALTINGNKQVFVDVSRRVH